MFILRPYQSQAVEAILSELRREPAALLQAPTGAGKTIIFAEIIRRWLELYPAARAFVAAHRQEIVAQSRDKIARVWPEGADRLGLACAGLGVVELGRPVTIGSVQTLARRATALETPGTGPDLLIIDEAHHVPAAEAGGQYRDLIAALWESRPGLKLLGVTATPFRLGQGLIYGPAAPDAAANIFPRLTHRIPWPDLTAAGYLTPVRAREGRAMAAELDKIKIIRGEYDPGQLNTLLIRRAHIESAVAAYEKYGEGRDKILIFAVSIEHAQKLAAAFNRAGRPAAAVHSGMEKRAEILADFENGTLKALVNIGVLSEGWDSPAVNLVIMCRPTKSPALFTQMVGRGVRPHPGKKDLLVLDLAENFKTHGDPADPLVKSKTGTCPAPFKVCPACQALTAAGSRLCPECGHRWTILLVDGPDIPAMLKIKLAKSGLTFSRVLDCSGHIRLSDSGRRMLVLETLCEPGGLTEKWLDMEGKCSGFDRGHAREFWRRFSGGSKPPDTLEEAIDRLDELRLPREVSIVNRSGFKIIREFA